MEDVLKKFLVVFVILILFFIVRGFNSNSPNQIKADYFDIGYGQSMYVGYNKVDEKTVQSLVKEYNQIKDIEQTNEEINYDKAVTIHFIYNDQISGSLVIDNKGVFLLGNRSGNFQIDENNDMYEKALKIYKEVKEQN
ncbi:hypothetical protein MKY51_06840 [Solibacillus sp. FSL R5-0691]|uniref:hypothetical protein n=1 Tax=Solibacillus sp. FSL R5-0691 TaxID=2921653 RepID=UPI0030CACD6B